MGGYSNGLNQLNVLTETFTRFYHVYQDSNSIKRNEIRAIAEDKSNRLWIGTPSGISVMTEDKSGQKIFKHYINKLDISNDLPHNFVQDIFLDRNKTIWIGTGLDGM